MTNSIICGFVGCILTKENKLDLICTMVTMKQEITDYFETIRLNICGGFAS